MVDTQSNKADYRRTYQLVDAETREPMNVDGGPVDDIQIELEDPRTRNPKIQGSLKTGEVVPVDLEQGLYSWAFPASEMQDIQDGRYVLGVLILADGRTLQSAVEPVQVYRGIVGHG